MLVTLGNPNPHDQGTAIPGPAVTTCSILDDKTEDGSYRHGFTIGTDAAAVRQHLLMRRDGVTHLGGNAAIAALYAAWPEHSYSSPSWVAVEPGERSPEEAADFERFLSEFWDCQRGFPADLEATHFTANGPPEGA